MTAVTPDLVGANGRTVRMLLGTGPSPTHASGRCSDLTDEQLGAVVSHVQGNVLVAADALKMRPWPPWMMGVLYPGRRSRP